MAATAATAATARPSWRRLVPADPASVGLIVALLLVVEVFPHRMGIGGYVTGVVFGANAGLVAVGLVLVFRSSRVVNFAQYQLGALPGIIFYELVHQNALARPLDAACHCALNGDSPVHWVAEVQFWLAAILCLALSAALGALSHVLLVRRFRNAPALAGTVATIALALGLGQLAGQVPSIIGDHVAPGAVPPPSNVTLTLGSGAQVALFNLPQLLSLGLAALVLPAVALLLRRTRLGVGVRAAADNPERAATLGVDDARVTTSVWAVAGLLSGISALLTAMSVGVGGIGGDQALVAVLAAFVLARTISMPVALSAAIALAVFTQGVLVSFGKGEVTTAVLLGIVLGVLVLRGRGGTGRVDVAAAGWAGAREVRPVPAELRGLPEVRRLRLRVAGVVGLVALGYPFLVTTGDVENGSVSLLYAIVGMSLLVLTGWAGLASLGQFAFAAVGGFVVALVAGRLGLTALVALPLAAIAGAGVAVLVGLPALRVRGFYLAIATLAFSLATTTLLLGQDFGGSLLPTQLSRPDLFGFSFDDERAFYYLCLFTLVLVVAAVAGLRRSKAARALIAARDNERAASLYGVDLVRARVQAFAVSGFVASLAGGLYAYQQRGVNVGNFRTSIGLLLFLMVLIGGLGSLSGPVLGAVFVEAVTLLTPSYGNMVVAVTAALILVAAPGGLTQLCFAARDMLLRRIATRRRIYVPSLASDSRPGWSPDARVPLASKAAPGGAAAFVPVRYRLPRQPLAVPVVAATGRGAQ